MRYSADDLRATAAEILKGRSPSTFLALAAQRAAEMFDETPEMWKSLGPYWGVMQALLREYNPGYAGADYWNDGEPVPDYLSLYDAGDPLLNWVAAMTYLNRNDDVIDSTGSAHSIDLPNGENGLYIPGSGLLEA